MTPHAYRIKPKLGMVFRNAAQLSSLTSHYSPSHELGMSSLWVSVYAVSLVQTLSPTLLPGGTSIQPCSLSPKSLV